jgi:endonuclease YncB( thermonuclease family)
MARQLYHYRGIISRAVDGDTLAVDIDLGFRVWLHNQSVRLARINAPEGKQTDATAYLSQFASHRCEIEVLGRDRYGRWIAEVYADIDAEELSHVNLSDRLLSLGLAHPWPEV